MIRNLANIAIVAVCIGTISGCQDKVQTYVPPAISSVPDQALPLIHAVERITDLGSMPLPNSKLRVRVFEVDNIKTFDHVIYVLENADGSLASAAVGSGQSHGKSTTSVTTVAP